MKYYHQLVLIGCFLCAFFLMSGSAMAALTEIRASREVRVYWQEGDCWGEEGCDVWVDEDSQQTNELGTFEATAKFDDYPKNMMAYQSSYIVVDNDKIELTAEGQAYSKHNYVEDWEDYEAESSISLGFTIDQNYSFSLSGKLKGDVSRVTLEKYDPNYHQPYYPEVHWKPIYNIHGSTTEPTTLDESFILSEGRYYFSLYVHAVEDCYDNMKEGSFENIYLIIQPAASVPIPQSLWLLLTGSIFLLLYTKYRTMA